MKIRILRTAIKGFTLIELLIVVAIIAILAAIAVPNFLEAQTRAKVSRNKADMRTLVTATETYHVDYNKYPIPSNADGSFMGDPVASSEDWFETKTAISLTTPIAYISSRCGDIFATKGSTEAQNFHYTSITYLDIRQNNNPSHNWRSVFRNYYRELKGIDPPSVIAYYYLGFGPDKKHNINAPHSGPVTEPHEHSEGAIYDPTNGTVSSGDVHYIGPGIGFL